MPLAKSANTTPITYVETAATRSRLPPARDIKPTPSTVNATAPARCISELTGSAIPRKVIELIVSTSMA